MTKIPLLLMLCCAPWALAGPDDSVVKVNRMKFEGDRRTESKTAGAWATGTVVSASGGESLVLTNKHVAPTADAFYFVLYDGMAYEASWVRAAEGVDLALLKIAKELPAAPLAEAEPAAGAEVRMWGCLHGGGMRARKGRVESDDDGHKDQEKYAFLKTRMPGGQGDSGSGMFDRDGHLFAVLYSGPINEGDGWNMCVHLADVRKFLGAPGGAGKKAADAGLPVRKQP